MEKLDLILKELQSLNQRVDTLDSNMVYKHDLERIATKLDLEDMVTKRDLELLTKEIDSIASQVAHNTEQVKAANE